MNKQQSVNTTKSAFQQVSLPRQFMSELNEIADAAGRSLAKQIEHSFRIAFAIEKILPSHAVQGLKSGVLPAAELLQGLAAILANPSMSPAFAEVIESNPVRYSADPSDPEVYLRRNADGTTDRGEVTDSGLFVPLESKKGSLQNDQKTSQARPRKREQKKSKSDATERLDQSVLAAA